MAATRGTPHPDVLVVGGGIIGLACARELAGRGLAVTVLERGTPGREASAAAAGMLAPLAEVPEAGPMFDACRTARDLWRPWLEELVAEAEHPVDHDTSGALVVALDDGEEAALDALTAAAREMGEDCREIPVDEARRRVPDLTPELRRALHLPGDHRVDNTDVCVALAEAAGRRGVRVVAGAEVAAVETSGKGVSGEGVEVTSREGGREVRHRAGALLVAAGAWSGRIPGLPALPVHPVRGQMLSLGGVAWPWAGTVRAGDRYAVRRAVGNAVPRHGQLLVGATVEQAGFEIVNTPAGLADLTAFVRRLLPGLAEAPVLSVWAGLRPGTPDGLPLLGAVPGAPGAWAATGHYRNGILLAPWTARRVADLLTGSDAADSAAEAFSPARFTDILAPA